MSSQALIPCPACNTLNSAIAFQCQSCGAVFDGAAGHSIALSRPRSRRVLPHDTQALVPVGTRSVVAPFRAPGLQSRSHILRNVKVAIVTFSDDAKVHTQPTSPENIKPFVLKPDASTNEKAGFELADGIWHKYCSANSADIIFFGDGDATSGGADPAQAAVDTADKLKKKGARIAAVGFEGETMDPHHLRALASSPALMWMAREGTLAQIFKTASRSLSSRRFQKDNEMFLIFVIDTSGSMNEDNKKHELEHAVDSSIAYLVQLAGI